MKNKLQPTRTSFSHFQCKKAPRWLSKFFHFGTENRADQLKNHPVYMVGLGGEGLRNQRNQKPLRPFFCYIMRTSSPPYLQILLCKKPPQCDVWWNDVLAMFCILVRIWEERESFFHSWRQKPIWVFWKQLDLSLQNTVLPIEKKIR